MNKLIYVFIISYLLIAGCSNQYTGLGFPYSMQDKQAKIDEISLPEEGQDVIKATEEILSASVEKINPSYDFKWSRDKSIPIFLAKPQKNLEKGKIENKLIKLRDKIEKMKVCFSNGIRR